MKTIGKFKKRLLEVGSSGGLQDISPCRWSAPPKFDIL
jgi:hypothetical protein